MNRFHFAATAALWLMLAGGAQAANITPLATTTPTEDSWNYFGNVASGDTYTFNPNNDGLALYTVIMSFTDTPPSPVTIWIDSPGSALTFNQNTGQYDGMFILDGSEHTVYFSFGADPVGPFAGLMTASSQPLPSSPVPEPASALLLLAGLGVVGRKARRNASQRT